MLDPELHGDLMGEDTCPDWRDWGATWISERNFTRAFDHRVGLASARARFAQGAARLVRTLQLCDALRLPSLEVNVRLALPSPWARIVTMVSASGALATAGSG